MKKALIILATLVLILNSLNVFAQSPLKIGHVNMGEIIASMPESDSAQFLLDADTRELETMLENMQVEYNKLFENYQANLEGYSQLIRQTKEAELMEMQNKIQAFQQSASQQLQQRNYELLQPIYDKVQQAIDKVANSEGFTYILDTSKGTVVFSSPNSEGIDSLLIETLGMMQ